MSWQSMSEGASQTLDYSHCQSLQGRAPTAAILPIAGRWLRLYDAMRSITNAFSRKQAMCEPKFKPQCSSMRLDENINHNVDES